MKKTILLSIIILGLFGCKIKNKSTTDYTTFTPTFQVDYAQCGDGNPPVVSSNSVSFGESGNSRAGRVISANGYKNIQSISATIDLSGLNQRSDFTGDYLNASFYAVVSPVQPIGSGYCDAEYSQCPYCDEIDFLETNGNKIFQSTLHLATAKNGPQRWESSFTAAANTNCYNWSTMKDDPNNGIHSLVGVIDVNLPFDILITFPSDYTNMTVTVSQNGKSAVVFDYLNNAAVAGSSTLDMSKLKTDMAIGWWLTPSYHNNWSPTGANDATPWYKNSGGDCSWGTLCGDGGYWKLSNVKVVAESKL